MYNLGFGNNLNYNFLETLALENHGLARRIYEDSDATLQLQVHFTSGAVSQAATSTMGQLQASDGASSLLECTSGRISF